jgi:altronate hydrolase
MRLMTSPSSTIALHREDSVVIAREALAPGTQLQNGLQVLERIPPGHKLALYSHANGQKVLRYGQIIGFASRPILAGQHVHEHNLEVGEFDRDYQYCADVKPVRTPAAELTFKGFRRPNGRVGTRNYIGILTSVNCSAHVANAVARAFERNPMAGYDPLAEFPNVDGVVALTHKTGCGMSSGEPLRILQRTIAGYAAHPNFSHVIVLGLGCEVNQIGTMFTNHPDAIGVRTLNIQAAGGARKTIEEGVEFVRSVLTESNQAQREPVPVSELSVALVCGGSDGYSGISANPALGAASDLVVAHGGTVILSETPETYGAEHLLTRRAISREVGEKLVERMGWWEKYGASQGVSLNANPSPGNKLGGLTTILEKSLGALAKGGSSNLMDVVMYAERPSRKGLIFMDAPGYDPVQVTGQIAGGANLVAFTTGRGSVFGSKPAPTVKLASNTRLFSHMEEDMDVNCGTVLDGEETIEQCGQRIFEKLLAVASGEKSKSEEQDFGTSEFAPWILGPVI